MSANSGNNTSSPRYQDVTDTTSLTCSGIKQRKKATFPKKTSLPSTRLS